ncbi:MAG: GAF domain-containing SpoIIE family protein phosphatase [Elainellaceae cyanobacterium]
MTATPVSPQPFDPQALGQPLDQTPGSQPTSTQPTNVFALKDVVARLYREQSKIQDLLGSLSFALRSFKNLNQFLELTPLIASRVADADGGMLVMIRDGRIQLERLHCQGEGRCQHVQQAMVKAVRDLAARMASSGPSEDASAAMAALDQHLSSRFGAPTQIFSTPILVRTAERGRLYLFSCQPDYVWTETRQKLTRLVADQTAVAIENNELTVELRKKERLDRELEIGAEIQVQLLPRQCPKIKGLDLAARCQTASRVGGDYYDFIPANHDCWSQPLDDLASRCWSIAIGDVMGKGVPAGLIMTMLRGMLRAEVLNQHSPARILQHLNHVMYSDLENSNRFVTLFYSEYDPETQVLSYSNAAHNPPLLWEAATQTIHRLDTSSGMLIGLDIDSQYDEAQVRLQTADVILYYTDGFTDAASSRGDRFGEAQVEQCFRDACTYGYSPQEILDYLFEQVHAFVGLARQRDDDMTLVVIKAQLEHPDVHVN